MSNRSVRGAADSGDSADDPIRLLAHNLDFWVPAVVPRPCPRHESDVDVANVGDLRHLAGHHRKCRASAPLLDFAAVRDLRFVDPGMASETVQIRAYEVRLSTKVRCHFAYRGVALLSPVFAVSAARPADVACDRPDRPDRLGARCQNRPWDERWGQRSGSHGRMPGPEAPPCPGVQGHGRRWKGTEWLESCEDRRDEGVQSCGVRGSLGEPALSSRSF